jgi:hypothetical protein
LNKESDQLFAIAENEEEKEDDDDHLIQSPSRLRNPTSRHDDTPIFKDKGNERLEYPGNEESKFSFGGRDPFQTKKPRGQSEVELRHMSTIQMRRRNTLMPTPVKEDLIHANHNRSDELD